MQQQRRKHNDCLDYSKWDAIGDDEGDDAAMSCNDDDEQVRRRRQPVAPRVTRLDQPSAVTFGSATGEIAVTPPPPPPPAFSLVNAAAVRGTSEEDLVGSSHTVRQQVASEQIAETSSSALASREEGPTMAAIPASWTDKGAAVRIDEEVEQGLDDGAAYAYYWSQDRAAVHLRLPLAATHPRGAAGREKKDPQQQYTVSVSHVLPYADRFHAVLRTEEPQRLEIRQTTTGAKNATTAATPSILLQGELAHPVHLAEDDDGTVDWCIQEHASVGRYILLTLNKAAPVMGMALWWKKVLREAPTEIDLALWLPQNNNNALQHAWDEAHAQFRRDRAGGAKAKYEV